MDLLKAQLERRKRQSEDQRMQYTKTIQQLREQLFQKSRLGYPYTIDLGGEQWGAGEGDEMLDEEGLRKKIAAELMEQLSSKFADDRKKLESQMAV